MPPVWPPIPQGGECARFPGSKLPRDDTSWEETDRAYTVQGGSYPINQPRPIGHTLVDRLLVSNTRHDKDNNVESESLKFLGFPDHPIHPSLVQGLRLGPKLNLWQKISIICQIDENPLHGNRSTRGEVFCILRQRATSSFSG